MKSKEFKRIFHLIIFEKIIFNNQNLNKIKSTCNEYYF